MSGSFLFAVVLFLQLICVHSRWRGNNYVNEDGILPYQRCNANHFHPGAVPILSEFYVHDHPHDVLISAISTWGAADPTGEPLALNSIDILVFYNTRDSPCTRYDNHCCVNSTAKSIDELPSITCSHQQEQVQGKWNFTAMYNGNHYTSDKIDGEFIREDYRVLRENPLRPPSVTITCPFKQHSILSLDKFPVTLTLTDKFSMKKSTSTIIDVCYEAVEELSDVVVCTEPLFGFSPNGTSPYWNGVPPYLNHNLLDSFLLYHINIHKGIIHLYHSLTL